LGAGAPAAAATHPEAACIGGACDQQQDRVAAQSGRLILAVIGRASLQIGLAGKTSTEEVALIADDFAQLVAAGRFGNHDAYHPRGGYQRIGGAARHQSHGGHQQQGVLKTCSTSRQARCSHHINVTIRVPALLARKED
jgi:hypothetical protein